MAVAIMGQAERDGGRVRDRQIKKERGNEQGGGQGRDQREKKEERKTKRNCYQIAILTHVSSATSVTIPDKQVTPHRQHRPF